MKSSIAAPSLRNSGLLATSQSRPVSSLQPREDLGARADRHRALGDDDRVGAQVRGDVVDDRPQGRQIGRAVVALRRADGQIHDLGRLTAAARSVVKCSRSASTLCSTSSARPGS